MSNEVFDSTFSEPDKLFQFIEAKRPLVLGIYVNLMTKLNVLKIIRFVKESPFLTDTKVVLGGPELRNNVIGYLSAGADLLVLGEGELSFAEVSETILQTGTVPGDIDGTALFKEGQVHFNAERSLIRDLDVLPFPARHKINFQPYIDVWKSQHGASTFSISTMRGCPYTCKWCSRAVYGGTYRRRSPPLVVNEMKELSSRYGAERIWFVDDVFTISHRWLKEFCEELKRQNILIPYEIITRSDRMNEEVIRLLKESGCFRVWIGAESGSQKILNAMDRRVDVNNVREMIVKVKEVGMEAGTFIMVGYPGEGWKEMRETISHLRRAAPSHFTITLAYPIAGTPLYEEVKASISASGPWEGITDRDYDFKRRYPTAFYRHAIRWINHSVRLNQSKHPLKKINHAIKSLVAQVLMLMSQVRS